MRKLTFLALLLFVAVPEINYAQVGKSHDLSVQFNGKYGQVEVGGNYVGAEFHHSRPLPSKISFYYPVANSIDLSTDYWKRDESQPFKVFVKVDNRTDTIGIQPCTYAWAPYEANFSEEKGDYKVDVSYQFCDDLPVMVVRMRFTNLFKERKTFDVKTILSTVLRTCQTYAWKDTAEVAYGHDGTTYLANFRYIDTDSASVFVANAGEPPLVAGSGKYTESDHKVAIDPQAQFNYAKTIAPSGKLEIVQLIGSCKITEAKRIVIKALRSWRESVAKNNQRILKYVYRTAMVRVPDKNLEHTALWSKAMLATDRHYINGSIVPMPCPAEYNFFFTHDVLLTDLGAIFYDVRRVKHDLLFIKSLTRSDSVLPHAYYWRDNGFKTEFASADNWNHLWFMIVCGTYLKHSNDIEMIKLLYPILKKSTEMTLSNLGSGGLMYSTRPDWWDIGNNYGTRSYLTALMVRALREYCYVSLRLRKDEAFAENCLATSNTLQRNLVERLWNSKVDYLLNTLDTTSVDYHYYAGSLIAVDYGLLDKGKANLLMETAREELLDKNLGIRVAMPADFDKLTSLYQFKDGEAGGSYVYLNGAVWPQTTAWYILALIDLGKEDIAKESLEKYLSLDGIQHSPNGQPSFFEYRFSDQSSPSYGKIDKPNFMWAGGWYLNTLYHLAGVRENEWNIYLSPQVPAGFENMEYDLTLKGELSRVVWKGSGEYFREILMGGKNLYSAVLPEGGKYIIVQRGIPAHSYLASASCIVKEVNYVKGSKTLEVETEGLVNQNADLSVVSPKPVRKILLGKRNLTVNAVMKNSDGVYTINLRIVFDKENEKVYFVF